MRKDVEREGSFGTLIMHGFSLLRPLYYLEIRRMEEVQRDVDPPMKGGICTAFKSFFTENSMFFHQIDQ